MPHEHRAARKQRMRRVPGDLTPRQPRQRMPQPNARADEHRAGDRAIGIKKLGERPRRKPPHRLPDTAARGERRDAVRGDERHAAHFQDHLAHPHARARRNAQHRAFVGPCTIHRLARHAHPHVAEPAQMSRQRTAARQPILLIEGRSRPPSRAPRVAGSIVAKTRRAHHRASNSAFVRLTKLAGSSSVPPSASTA